MNEAHAHPFSLTSIGKTISKFVIFCTSQGYKSLPIQVPRELAIVKIKIFPLRLYFYCLTCSRASPSLKSPFKFRSDISSSQVNSSESVTSPNGLKSISHTFPYRTERTIKRHRLKSSIYAL